MPIAIEDLRNALTLLRLLPLTASVTYDAPSVAAGGTTTTTITVTGAALGDYIQGLSFGVDLQGLQASAESYCRRN